MSVHDKPEYAHNEILEYFKKYVFNLVSENLSDCIDVTEAFSNAAYEDHDSAYSELYKLLEKNLSDLGLDLSNNDIIAILDSYDYKYEHNRYYEDGDYFDGILASTGPSRVAIDQIDDLFEKS